MQVRRFAYALGAEVTGLDLKAPLDALTITAIRRAWLDNQLLYFPDQNLEKQELLAFAALFGELENIPDNADPDTPGILLLTNRPVNGKPWDGYKNGPAWHSDRSYDVQPTAGIFLNCKEIPQVGGDTMFANMYMAYDTLSAGMKGLIDGLSAIHDRSIGQIPTAMRLLSPDVVKRAEVAAAERAALQPPAVQPVVRVHPGTGRRSLYLTDRAQRFLGMTKDESQPLIRYLNEHSVSYEFTYRHQWKVNDLLMWDNRCTLHLALCDYDLERDARNLIRACFFGEKTGYEYVEEPATDLALSSRAT